MTFSFHFFYSSATWRLWLLNLSKVKNYIFIGLPKIKRLFSSWSKFHNYITRLTLFYGRKLFIWKETEFYFVRKMRRWLWCQTLVKLSKSSELFLHFFTYRIIQYDLTNCGFINQGFSYSLLANSSKLSRKKLL